MGQLLRRHMFWAKHDVASIIPAPVPVQKTAFAFHLPEKGGAGIGGEDMKCGALKAVLLDPLCGDGEHVAPVFIETEDEAPVHLDSMIMQDADAARVILGTDRKSV